MDECARPYLGAYSPSRVLKFPQVSTLDPSGPCFDRPRTLDTRGGLRPPRRPVERATAGGASVIHVDIMDGHFVPNLTLGPPVVKSLRRATRLPLDCHLMIENPDQYIPDFAESGADWISVHQEACPHLNRTLNLIKEHGCRAGVVINPATPVETLSEVLDIVDYVLVMSVNPGFGAQKFIPSTLHKMRKLSEIRAERGYTYRIEGGWWRWNRHGWLTWYALGRRFWWRGTQCSAKVTRR